MASFADWPPSGPYKFAIATPNTMGELLRGASVQGNQAAREEAAKAAVTFLRKVFGLAD